MSEYHCRSHNPDTVVGCDLNKNSRHVRSGRVGFFNPSLWTLCFTYCTCASEKNRKTTCKTNAAGCVGVHLLHVYACYESITVVCDMRLRAKKCAVQNHFLLSKTHCRHAFVFYPPPFPSLFCSLSLSFCQ